jgi:hypothetical protein
MAAGLKFIKVAKAFCFTNATALRSMPFVLLRDPFAGPTKTLLSQPHPFGRLPQRAKVNVW